MGGGGRGSYQAAACHEKGLGWSVVVSFASPSYFVVWIPAGLEHLQTTNPSCLPVACAFQPAFKLRGGVSPDPNETYSVRSPGLCFIMICRRTLAGFGSGGVYEHLDG